MTLQMLCMIVFFLRYCIAFNHIASNGQFYCLRILVEMVFFLLLFESCSVECKDSRLPHLFSLDRIVQW